MIAPTLQESFDWLPPYFEKLKSTIIINCHVLDFDSLDRYKWGDAVDGTSSEVIIVQCSEDWSFFVVSFQPNEPEELQCVYVGHASANVERRAKIAHLLGNLTKSKISFKKAALPMYAEKIAKFLLINAIIRPTPISFSQKWSYMCALYCSKDYALQNQGRKMGFSYKENPKLVFKQLMSEENQNDEIVDLVEEKLTSCCNEMQELPQNCSVFPQISASCQHNCRQMDIWETISNSLANNIHNSYAFHKKQHYASLDLGNEYCIIHGSVFGKTCDWEEEFSEMRKLNAEFPTDWDDCCSGCANPIDSESTDAIACDGCNAIWHPQCLSPKVDLSTLCNVSEVLFLCKTICIESAGLPSDILTQAKSSHFVEPRFDIVD
eukprot:TRINITY_DN779_c0_g1_i10.p1 TRINITY_DN779_c0_g1~~TRINITY_DN779_c0_g1_i10.p1  ORF type:complete len:378 (+),score=62.28 TRINITY_DN779_c0_g1_i10:2852-3985(+)